MNFHMNDESIILDNGNISNSLSGSNSEDNDKEIIKELKYKLSEKCDEIDKLTKTIENLKQIQIENDFHSYKSMDLSDIQLHNKINSWLKKTGLNRKLIHSYDNKKSSMRNSRESSASKDVVNETLSRHNLSPNLFSNQLNISINENLHNVKTHSNINEDSLDSSRLNDLDYNIDSIDLISSTDDSPNHNINDSLNHNVDWNSNIEDEEDLDNDQDEEDDEDSIGINYSGRYISAADLYLIVLQDLIALRMELSGTQKR